MDRETGPSGRGLETYRGYLELLVRSRLDPRLRGKLDPGDLVQQTLTRAVSARDRFRDGDGPLAAWLRTDPRQRPDRRVAEVRRGSSRAVAPGGARGIVGPAGGVPGGRPDIPDDPVLGSPPGLSLRGRRIAFDVMDIPHYDARMPPTSRARRTTGNLCSIIESKTS